MLSKSYKYQSIKTLLHHLQQEITDNFHPGQLNPQIYYQQLTSILFKALKHLHQFLKEINQTQPITLIAFQIIKALNESFLEYKGQNIFMDGISSYNERSERQQDDEIYHFMNTRNNLLPVEQCFNTYENDKNRKELHQFVQQFQSKKSNLSKNNKHSMIVEKSAFKVQRKATFDPKIQSMQFQDKKASSLAVSSQEIFQEMKDNQSQATANVYDLSIKESQMQSESNLTQKNHENFSEKMENDLSNPITEVIITDITCNKNQSEKQKTNKEIPTLKSIKSKKSKKQIKPQIKKSKSKKMLVKYTKSLTHEVVKPILQKYETNSDDCSLKIIKTSSNLKAESEVHDKMKLESEVINISMKSLLKGEVIGINIINPKKESTFKGYIIVNGVITEVDQQKTQSLIDSDKVDVNYAMEDGSKMNKVSLKEEPMNNGLKQENKEELLYDDNINAPVTLKINRNIGITQQLSIYHHQKIKQEDHHHHVQSQLQNMYKSSQEEAQIRAIHMGKMDKHVQKIEESRGARLSQLQCIPKKILQSKMSLQQMKHSQDNNSHDAISNSNKQIHYPSNIHNQISRPNSDKSTYLKSRMINDTNKPKQNASRNSPSLKQCQKDRYSIQKSDKAQQKQSLIKISKGIQQVIKQQVVESKVNVNAIVNDGRNLKMTLNQLRKSLLCAGKQQNPKNLMYQMDMAKAETSNYKVKADFTKLQNQKLKKLTSKNHKSELQMKKINIIKHDLSKFSPLNPYKNSISLTNQLQSEFSPQKLSLADQRHSNSALHSPLQSPMSSFYSKNQSYDNQSNSLLKRTNSEIFQLSAQYRIRNRRQKMKEYMQLIQMTHKKFCGHTCTHIHNAFKQGDSQQKISSQLLKLMLMKQT